MAKDTQVAVATSDEAPVKKPLTFEERLNAQPKRTVRIPHREDIKQRFVMVSVNGHTFQITRGVDVDVPQVVYDILLEAGEI